MKMTKFSEWITKKYLDWQANLGERKTIEEFAGYLGVSRPLLNMWMNGDRPKPGRQNIKMLVEIFGLEIYDVIGEQRPNPYLHRISQAFENLPPEKQQQLAEEAERYEAKNERSKKSPAKRKTSEN